MFTRTTRRFYHIIFWINIPLIFKPQIFTHKEIRTVCLDSLLVENTLLSLDVLTNICFIIWYTVLVRISVNRFWILSHFCKSGYLPVSGITPHSYSLPRLLNFTLLYSNLYFLLSSFSADGFPDYRGSRSHQTKTQLFLALKHQNPPGPTKSISALLILL